MEITDAMRVVTEDIQRMKAEYIGLMLHLCNLVVRALKKRTPAELLDLQAILEVELAKRHVEGVG